MFPCPTIAYGRSGFGVAIRSPPFESMWADPHIRGIARATRVMGSFQVTCVAAGRCRTFLATRTMRGSHDDGDRRRATPFGRRTHRRERVRGRFGLPARDEGAAA